MDCPITSDNDKMTWIPAFAGMTKRDIVILWFPSFIVILRLDRGIYTIKMDSRLRGNDNNILSGMTMIFDQEWQKVSMPYGTKLRFEYRYTWCIFVKDFLMCFNVIISQRDCYANKTAHKKNTDNWKKSRTRGCYLE